MTSLYLILCITSNICNEDIYSEWQVKWWRTDVQIIGSRLLRVSLLPSVFVFKSYTSGRVDFHCGASTSDVTLQLWQTVLLFPLPPQRSALSSRSSQNLSSRHCSICICLHTLDTLQYFHDFLSLSKIRYVTSAHTLCYDRWGVNKVGVLSVALNKCGQV